MRKKLKPRQRTYQLYIFSKKRKSDIWSRESFRIKTKEIPKTLKDYKKENTKLGYTQFKTIKLPVRK